MAINKTTLRRTLFNLFKSPDFPNLCELMFTRDDNFGDGGFEFQLLKLIDWVNCHQLEDGLQRLTDLADMTLYFREKFSNEEVITLAFCLGLDLESVGHSLLAQGFILALFLLAFQNNKSSELANWIRTNRPDFDFRRWKDIF